MLVKKKKTNQQHAAAGGAEDTADGIFEVGGKR